MTPEAVQTVGEVLDATQQRGLIDQRSHDHCVAALMLDMLGAGRPEQRLAADRFLQQCWHLLALPPSVAGPDKVRLCWPNSVLFCGDLSALL